MHDKLKEFHTSKKDIAANNEVSPPEESRIKSEDVYPEGNMIDGGGLMDDSDTDMGLHEVAKSVYTRVKDEVVDLNDFKL